MSELKLYRKKRAQILRRIEKARQDLKEFEDSCDHPEEYCEHTIGADTGNWDRQDDRYWSDNRCHFCGKTWHSSGQRETRGKRVNKLSDYVYE